MVGLRTSWPIASLAGLSALLTSCATGPTVRLEAPPPEVQLGAVLQLLPVETSSDRVDALVDRDGRAHVIIAAETVEETHHVVVSPDGVVERERIAAAASPSEVSAAFDQQGRLHVLLDDKHLVREQNGWLTAQSTPWKAAGAEALGPRLVPGRKGFAWAFTVQGKDVGSKGRWEWYGIGGAMGAIIFPWYSGSQKLVMVPDAEMAQPLWYLVDPEDNLDALNVMPALDDVGNLHVVYDASREGIAASYEPRYAHTALVRPSPPSETQAADAAGRSRTLHPLSGSRIFWFGPEHRGLFQAALAVDPVSGTVLVVRAHEASLALEEGQWRNPVRLPLSHFWEPRLAAAGGNAFHLTTTREEGALYLHYAGRAWSAPIDLGPCDTAHGDRWHALDVASDGSARAFAVWPTPTGIVGRWIEWPGEAAAPATGPAAAVPPGAAQVPAELAAFVKGDAELVTPGVFAGFSEAWASAEHGALNKNLHDTGQWETLATVVLKDRYGDNLAWYYLGRAAEGMGLCDVAERYYRTSRERSGSLLTRCLSIACHGFELPEILEERFRTVDAMRTEGKCVVPREAEP